MAFRDLREFLSALEALDWSREPLLEVAFGGAAASDPSYNFV